MSFYGHFNLHMDRSPGFGSTAYDFRPIKTRFHFGSGALHLNLAAHHNSLTLESFWPVFLAMIFASISFTSSVSFRSISMSVTLPRVPEDG